MKTSPDNLETLEDLLGHRFTQRSQLVRALTHRSLANELAAQSAALLMAASGETPAANGKLQTRNGQPQTQNGEPNAPHGDDNERLEFLGDAVLGMLVAEALFAEHADWQEGELTRIRAQLVSRKHMAEVAEQIGLGQYLRLSRSEDKTGLRRKSTVLSNTMEAVIAALFLDGGLEPVRRFVRQYVLAEAADQLAEQLRSGAALGNYKSALQEQLQATHAGVPIYRVKGESGPDHHKRFMVEVRMRPSDGQPGTPLARGVGSTKKNAEQDAARRALELLASQSLLHGTGPEPAADDSASNHESPAQSDAEKN